MGLKPGDHAPLFDVADIYGRRVSLSALQGRPLLLSFYRSAVCPLCNLRLYHLLDRYPAYQQRYGLAIVSFFESAPDYARAFLDRFHAPFPLVADRERIVYQQYGLRTSWLGTARGAMRQSAYSEAKRLNIGDWRRLPGFFRMDGRKFRMPAEFLLGPDLTIRVAYYGRDAGDFLMFSELEHYLASPALASRVTNRPM